MRRTLEASVWPRVEWENSSYNEERRVNAIIFALANRGVGPARIARVEILLKGERMANEDALLLGCCLDGETREERSLTLKRLTEQRSRARSTARRSRPARSASSSVRAARRGQPRARRLGPPERDSRRARPDSLLLLGVRRLLDHAGPRLHAGDPARP